MGIRLTKWQWIVLAAPIAIILTFVIVSAGVQIHTWGISWIWAVFTLMLLGWRWLIVKWTGSEVARIESVIEEVTAELEATTDAPRAVLDDAAQQAELIVQRLLQETQDDRPIWEDWTTFWQRCLNVVTEIAHIYHPEVKYPLLNIYVPQAYALIRGTTDDMDQWMQKLAPALNQVTVGQAYQGYEMYRKLEPSARKLWKTWRWVQWAVNPAAAAARTATEGYGTRANQQLLFNLSQLLREAALRNLAKQAIALYGGNTLPLETFAPSEPSQLPTAKTETLRNILDQAEPVAAIAQSPINILLIGRTGAGKSSLINTLFQAEKAEVDVLPSTDRIQNYSWQTPSGEALNLWDTPGYEQVKQDELRALVLDYAETVDLLLVVTPALDPALQMDVDFLADLKGQVDDIPAIAIVTQVDRLRPLRQWEPPYDWLAGDRPKEKSIRQATEYRIQSLGPYCDPIIPIVTNDLSSNRVAWNIEVLSLAIMQVLDPAKQLRLARFLRNQEVRTAAAAQIIEQYTVQMATTQGLATLIKSPVLQFISTMTTGSPALAQVLLQQIPVEQLPIVIGKLQMAYDLFTLIKPNEPPFSLDLLKLWPFILNGAISVEDDRVTVTQNAWAFGHALVEYWSQDLSTAQLEERFKGYLAAL